ncbi:MAG: marine proteobacterial sortase target protein [Alphaproteobacteria bacterium]|nr:marine proteobacterial sortase target protein [Alphaproteobacteria bacterium]
MPSTSSGPAGRASAATALLSQAFNALVALLLVLAALAWAQAQAAPGAAQVFRKPGEAGRGELLFRERDSGLWRAVPMLSTEVEIGVGGVSARVAVVQRFKNKSPDWLEGIYVFPLPETAAVDSLRMVVGDRVIDGRVAERQQAKKEYDQARDSGQRASLVEQERANIFTASVANIAPGEEIEVRLGYAQTVERDGSAYRLRFPMVVGPRYIAPGPALIASGGAVAPTPRVPDADRITPPVLDPALGPINPVEIAVRLDPGFPVAGVNSPFHAIDRRQDGDGAWRIALADGAVPADRDFELEWSPAASSEPLARIFAETEGDGRYALLTVMPPSAGAEPFGLLREAIFVIDTSGSMHGESIAQAKQALDLALARLKPSDSFNVIEFNNKARRLFARAEPATPAFLNRARAWVDLLKAEGGTEMRQALDLALDGNIDPTRLRQVVFLTDGAVGDEAALLDQVRAKLGDTRLFTVGIGSAPNGYFMRKTAEVGRGSAIFIGKPEQVAERMDGLFRRLERPAVTDLAVAWPGRDVDALPNPLPDLYEGEPVVVAARLPHGVAGPVSLTGKIAGKPWRQELALAAGDDPPAGVPALWARRKVETLEDLAFLGARPEDIRAQTIAVALRHNLVTKYTSLVAVDATPARPENAPLAGGAMPTNLPKGWTYDKVFGEPSALPQPTGQRHGALPGALLRQSAAVRAHSLAPASAASAAAPAAAPAPIGVSLGGQALSLPQTATPAELLMITGALLLAIGGFVLVAIRRRSAA